MLTVQSANSKAEEQQVQESEATGINRIHNQALTDNRPQAEPSSLIDRVSTPDEKDELVLPTTSFFTSPGRSPIETSSTLTFLAPMDAQELTLSGNPASFQELSLSTTNPFSEPQLSLAIHGENKAIGAANGPISMSISAPHLQDDTKSSCRITQEIENGTLSISRGQETSKRALSTFEETQNEQIAIRSDVRSAITAFKEKASACDDDYFEYTSRLRNSMIQGEKIDQQQLSYANLMKDLNEQSKAHFEKSAKQLMTFFQQYQEGVWSGYEQTIKKLFAIRMTELQCVREEMTEIYRYDDYNRHREIEQSNQKIAESSAIIDQVLKVATANADLAQTQFDQALKVKEAEYQNAIEQQKTANAHEISLKKQELKENQVQLKHRESMETLANKKSIEDGKRKAETYKHLINASATVSSAALNASAKVASSAVNPCKVM